MDKLSQAISEIGIVPVIKLSDPERDAVKLAKALCGLAIRRVSINGG